MRRKIYNKEDHENFDSPVHKPKYKGSENNFIPLILIFFAMIIFILSKIL
ncbi:MAG: hypothetical protein KAT32_02390 [Candidatus Moranbacteria bacterium]|nr:hypothetical protein [Candidatus Moranbacteria bacterium]